jgi:DNA-binding PadR family transcriptional regulator
LCRLIYKYICVVDYSTDRHIASERIYGASAAEDVENMRTEELEGLILMTLGTREFYGYEVQKQLASNNIKVGISRLYRILNGMLRKRLLEDRWEKSGHGPNKRVYRLSAEGRKERNKSLLKAIEVVHSFYSEYLRNLPKKADVFRKICRLICRELKGRDNVALVTTKFSVAHERVLRALHDEVPEAKIFLIKPKSLKADLNLEYVVLLDGAYDNCPLKNSYVDLLVVGGVPGKDAIEKCLREWHRVLKQDGTLAVSTPSVLVEKYEDPLSIGNFVEKFEHETLEKEAFLDGTLLKSLLKNSCAEARWEKIAHISIFLGLRHRPSAR